MRRMKKMLAWGIAMAAVLAVAMPALSATKIGSITLTSLEPGQITGDVVPVEWDWTRGSEVTSTDKVKVLVSTTGLSWTRISSAIPIRHGRFDWDTTGIPQGAFAVKLKVVKEPVQDIVSPIYIDNTAPTVSILSPSQDQVIVDDASPVPFAIVAGVATLRADARDAFSGVANVLWYLDYDPEADEQEPIAEGATTSYDFSGATPGEHGLTAVALDFAGNSAESTSVSLLTLPGTGLAADPGVIPDEEPTLPTLPGDEEPTLPTLPGGDEEPTLPDPLAEVCAIDSTLPFCGGSPPETPPLPPIP